MLGSIAAFTGGLVKDTVVGVSNLASWVVDEVSSIPDSFSAGYEHGLITGDDLSATMSGPETEEDHLDHHIEEETPQKPSFTSIARQHV